MIYITNDIIYNATESQNIIEHKGSFISFLKATNLNGSKIMNYDRKQFGADIVQHCNEQKLKGPSLKLLKLVRNYDLSLIPFNKMSVSPSTSMMSLHSEKSQTTEYIEEQYNLPKAKTIPKQENSNITIPNNIQECESQHIIKILNGSIFDSDDFKDTLINTYRSNIIQYIQLTKLSGQQIIEMTRKDFGQDLIKCCDGNQKVNGPAMKLYKTIKAFKDFKSLSQETPSGNTINSAPSSMEECDEEYLYQIVDELTNDDKSKPYKENILSYFKEKKIDGAKFKNMTRKQFGTDLIEACNGNKKLNGIGGSLFKRMQNYKFDNLSPQNISDIARSLTLTSLKKAHEKIENCMAKNGIDGKVFMIEYNKLSNGTDNDNFKQFFNVKICDQKKTSEKYTKFTQWLIAQIQELNDESIILNKNRIDFIKFILDGFDEFISNIFEEKKITKQIFLEKGGRTIGKEISDEYGIARGGIQNLCLAMEEYIKSDNCKQPTRSIIDDKSWITRESTRSLSVTIDDLVDDNDDDKKEGIDLIDVSSLEQCNADQIVEIFKQYILPKLMDKEPMKNNKDKIVDFFVSNKIDGKYLKSISRKDFGPAMVNFVGDSKVKGGALKIYKEFQIFEFNKISNNQSSKPSPSPPKPIKSMEECTTEQLIFIMDQHIFDEINQAKLNDNRDDILACISNKNIDGPSLFAMERKDFASQIVEHCNDKKLLGPSIKLYKYLQNFDINKINVPQNEQTPSSSVPNINPHRLSLTPPIIQSQTSFIWNAEIKELKQCSSKHILYILNKYIFPKLKDDKLLNENKSIFQSYFENNQIDGEHIASLDRKSFANEIVKFGDDNKLRGSSMKLYKEFKIFNFESLIQEANEDDQDSKSQTDLPSTLEQCTSQQIMYLVKNHLVKNEKVSQHKDVFISFFKENPMDGATLKSMKRKEFGTSVVSYAQNRKMNGPAMTVYKILNGYDDLTKLNPNNQESLSPPNGHTTKNDNNLVDNNSEEIWSPNNPSFIEQCTVEQIIYITQSSEIFKTQLSQYKDGIIKYLKQNEISGQRFKSIRRPDFAHQIATELNQSELTATLGKLWKDINEYKLPTTLIGASASSGSEPETEPDTEPEPEPNDVLWNSKPRQISDCTIEQLQHIITHYLLTSNNEKLQILMPYRSKILKFMLVNKYNGTNFINAERKDFGNKLKEYLKDDKTLGTTVKLYSALKDFDLKQIPELRKRIVPKRRKHGSSSKESTNYMPPIDEKAPSVVRQSSKAVHTRSPSAPTISINGSPVKKHHRYPSLSSKSTANDRAKNEKLAELPQDEFCQWVIKCVQNHPPSKTVKTMIDRITKKHQLNGKQLIPFMDDPERLRDFIQDKMECNEIFFLQYVTDKIIGDYKDNKIPFENYHPKEFADYVETQSYSFPAEAFRKAEIDGDIYTTKDSKFLLTFLRKHCGFRAGTARPLIANIDKYPIEPIINNSQNGGGGMNGHNRHPTFDKFAGYTNQHKTGYKSPPHTMLVNPRSLSSHNRSNHRNDFTINGYIDDAQSDASEFNEQSMSYSVNPRTNHEQTLERLFADHAMKIYERENERHWRRIKERLNKVGIGNLLFHIKDNFNDEDDKKSNDKHYSTSNNKRNLDEKYFIKQAKLVYKIEVDRFYQELYKDIMNDALGFDTSFNTAQAREWIIKYELKKLHETIILNEITKKKFNREMSNKDEIFCKHYMGFLPKKRRKVLWKKLKKDIAKGKLNHL